MCFGPGLWLGPCRQARWVGRGLRRSRVGPGDRFCETVRNDLQVPLTLEGPGLDNARRPGLVLVTFRPATGAPGASRTARPVFAGAVIRCALRRDCMPAEAGLLTLRRRRARRASAREGAAGRRPGASEVPATRLDSGIGPHAVPRNASMRSRFRGRSRPGAGRPSAPKACRVQQNAIRRLDPTQLHPIIDAYLVTGDPWWGTQLREQERIPGGHSAALSKTRLGQQRFREAMLARYGDNCAFTGPQPPGALEAAHLYLYRKKPEHDPKGGLLLRCDLHALFDRWLITINPDAWLIQVAPELACYPSLAALDGQPVRLPANFRPRLHYVETHAMMARSAWADSPRRDPL